MDFMKRRRLRYLMRLCYPAQVVMTGSGLYKGYLPDLQITYEHDDLLNLYAGLDLLRRKYILDRVREDLAVPHPNAHLKPKAAAPKLEAMTSERTIPGSSQLHA